MPHFPTEEDYQNLFKDFHDIFYWKEAGYEYTASICVGNGWVSLIRKLIEALKDQAKAEGTRLPVITDIKSKYGNMSVSADYTTAAMDNIIEDFEDISGSICETCGAFFAKQQLTAGWVTSMCQLCARRN
jgi:hypothetical protein